MKTVDVTIPDFSGKKSPDQKSTIMFWFKGVGERVNKDEELVEIQTDKAILDIESPATGKIVKILADAGDEIQDGQKIGEIEV